VTATQTSTVRAVTARRGSFLHDVVSVAIRSLKLIPREPEAVLPALVVPVFFFAVNTGSLSNLAGQGIPGFDYKAFQLPVAIIFAVTGISRASQLVMDIQDGYFDRMLLSPMHRQAILLGLMVADFVLVVLLSLPVVLLGLLVGVSFETGVLGGLVFVLLAGAWGLAFTGFPYAIALKTGSPAAVSSSFILFFPFAFLTTAMAPMAALSGWLETVARVNPVTYVLAGLRSLVSDGWAWSQIGQSLLAILAVAAVSQALAFLALRGRVRRG
jgi:ABC-2 type transport system permease protein